MSSPWGKQSDNELMYNKDRAILRGGAYPNIRLPPPPPAKLSHNALNESSARDCFSPLSRPVTRGSYNSISNPARGRGDYCEPKTFSVEGINWACKTTPAGAVTSWPNGRWREGEPVVPPSCLSPPFYLY